MNEEPAREADRRLAGLHVLADDHPRWKLDPVDQARGACRGGAAVIQLRVKHATDARALGWAREIRELTRDGGVVFVVNDRFDLALLSGADGVHLGQEDLPPSRVPGDVRQRLLIGRSTHTLEQARAAVAEPISYVAFGPVFATASKDSPYPPRGLSVLAEVVRLVAPRPLVAIGGLTAERAPEALRAGAAAVAVISAVAGADDPEAATRELVGALDGVSA